MIKTDIVVKIFVFTYNFKFSQKTCQFVKSLKTTAIFTPKITSYKKLKVERNLRISFDNAE